MNELISVGIIGKFPRRGISYCAFVGKVRCLRILLKYIGVDTVALFGHLIRKDFYTRLTRSDYPVSAKQPLRFRRGDKPVRHQHQTIKSELRIYTYLLLLIVVASS